MHSGNHHHSFLINSEPEVACIVFKKRVYLSVCNIKTTIAELSICNLVGSTIIDFNSFSICSQIEYILRTLIYCFDKQIILSFIRYGNKTIMSAVIPKKSIAHTYRIDITFIIFTYVNYWSSFFLYQILFSLSSRSQTINTIFTRSHPYLSCSSFYNSPSHGSRNIQQ